MPMAITLHTIITRATLGDHETVAGAIAKSGVSMHGIERRLII